MFILPKGTTLTSELLGKFIKAHQSEVNNRLMPLKKMYESEHEILSVEKKDGYKPDNRLVVNFPKYIVDTLNGFFIGIPIKISHNDEAVDDYLNFLNNYNNQEDNNAELSKMCSIYGRGYELLFIDENANVGITKVNPIEAFVIYDDSILRRPLFGVRYYKNSEGELEGSFSDATHVYYFNQDYAIIGENPHYFGGVPIIEYVENEERTGAFESVKTLINAYNKALSEKANDVDYYADAYLKILGAALDEDQLRKLRDSRIINMEGEEAHKIIVEFLQKPDADGTQENLINRLEQLIFQISMVANINDESFGNSSGIALAYKLQSMSNLAKTKERKFMAGLHKRHQLIANIPTSKLNSENWFGINYKFTRNLPANILEETQIAQNLTGIVSEKTQLSVLSIIKNVQDEIDQKNEETGDVDVPLIESGLEPEKELGGQ